jgi:hypothetical protein
MVLEQLQVVLGGEVRLQYVEAVHQDVLHVQVVYDFSALHESGEEDDLEYLFRAEVGAV